MSMHRKFRLFALLVAATALLAPLPGCDRGEEEMPSIIVVTPQPVRGVIAQTSFTGFVTDVWVAIEVLVGDRGKIDITVNWSNEETWIFVYFGDTACSFDQLDSRECPFLIASETKEPRPRVLFTDILDPGTYYLYLYNVPKGYAPGVGSDVTEAVSLQLGLTVGFDLLSGEEQPVRLGRPVVISPPQL
jgi:hypothetical protein